MPNIHVTVGHQFRGVFLDEGASGRAAQRAIIAINDGISEEGVRRVIERNESLFQNPTGYYNSRVVVDRRTQYRGITDQGVVYGGWLEGVTERNRTTRFKGYWTFRVVAASLNRDALQLVEPILNDLLTELNGD